MSECSGQETRDSSPDLSLIPGMDTTKFMAAWLDTRHEYRPDVDGVRNSVRLCRGAQLLCGTQLRQRTPIPNRVRKQLAHHHHTKFYIKEALQLEISADSSL